MFVMLKFAWVFIFVAVSGVSAESPQENGDVEITEHSYLVSIRKEGKHMCSGVILDKHHVLTSSLCVPPFEHVWNSMNDVTVFTETGSLKITGRPNFGKEMFSQSRHSNIIMSGVGVIKLLLPLRFGNYAKPIEFSTSKLSAGTELHMVGWRIKNSKGEDNLHLKEAPLEIVDHEKCQAFHKDISDSEFCTQPKSNGEFCKGDSGSALIHEGKFVGVATFGISCEETPIPDVHASTDNIRKYIEDVIQN